MESRLRQLFADWAGEEPVEVLRLSANGSNRKYWRMVGRGQSCVAAHNDCVRENEAFFYYSRVFREKGIKVPEVFVVDATRSLYLQEDLGDTTLYGYMCDRRKGCGGFDAEMLAVYKKVLSDLSDIQIAGRDVDFTKAYPRPAFDRQSIRWDLNYFKYYFLKLKYVPFDEELLERDFETLADFLLEADDNYFLYRDFQSRNVMLLDGTPYYIDFQGGRKGAAQYDVASLLYSAKSDIPNPIRQELLDHYLGCLSGKAQVEKAAFLNYFWGFVLVRIMQALGAYGYRGYYEKKEHFIGSIPLAINNLRTVVSEHPLPVELPHLSKVLQHIVDSDLAQTCTAADAGLTVTVMSFSYKRGLPQDASGNGGGFVFDCRALPNPGRYVEYRCYTGKDRPVIAFLQGEEEVERFLSSVRQVVRPSIEKYLERNFTSLMVCFGCTGGQHRSVYCAESVAAWIKNTFDCKVVIVHREQQ